MNNSPIKQTFTLRQWLCFSTTNKLSDLSPWLSEFAVAKPPHGKVITAKREITLFEDGTWKVGDIRRVSLKPPHGIKPRMIWLLEREEELVEAINRYREIKKPEPIDWSEELLDIRKEIAKL